MNYIITLATTLTLIVASNSQLPKVVHQVRLAQ